MDDHLIEIVFCSNKEPSTDITVYRHDAVCWWISGIDKFAQRAVAFERYIGVAVGDVVRQHKLFKNFHCEIDVAELRCETRNKFAGLRKSRCNPRINSVPP